MAYDQDRGLEHRPQPAYQPAPQDSSSALRLIVGGVIVGLVALIWVLGTGYARTGPGAALPRGDAPAVSAPAGTAPAAPPAAAIDPAQPAPAEPDTTRSGAGLAPAAADVAAPLPAQAPAD